MLLMLLFVSVCIFHKDRNNCNYCKNLSMSLNVLCVNFNIRLMLLQTFSIPVKHVAAECRGKGGGGGLPVWVAVSRIFGPVLTVLTVLFVMAVLICFWQFCLLILGKSLEFGTAKIS